MESASVQARNSKIGLGLFFVYSTFYLGFVLVNAFATEWVEWVPFAGLNLAILWGFGLILLAVVLALIYGFVCTTSSEQKDGE